eukprot:Rmarinus@m.22963
MLSRFQNLFTFASTCALCEQEYNSTNKAVRQTPCGHKICHECLLYSNTQSVAPVLRESEEAGDTEAIGNIKCPTCNFHFRLEDVIFHAESLLEAPLEQQASTGSLHEDYEVFTIFDDNSEIIAGELERLQQTLALSGQEEVSMVTVMGGTRVGKSWFASYLCKREGLFESAAGLESHTMGAHAYAGSSLDDLRWRNFMGPLPDGTGRRRVVVVDLEGMGHDSLEKDFSLVLPFLLTSRCIVYVAKQGGLARDSFLQQASACVKLAERLRGGSTDSAPFGDMHLVINSVTGFLATSYLTVANWMRPELENLSLTTKSAEKARKRNETRTLIQNSFRSFHIHALPAPTDGSMSAWDETFGGVSRTFVQTSQAAVESILSDLARPKYLAYSETEVTASNLPVLLRQLSEEAENEGVINVPGVADAIDKRTCSEMSASFVGDAERGPLSVEEIGKHIDPEDDAAVTEYLDREVERVVRSFQSALQAKHITLFAVKTSVPLLRARLKECAGNGVVRAQAARLSEANQTQLEELQEAVRRQEEIAEEARLRAEEEWQRRETADNRDMQASEHETNEPKKKGWCSIL